MKRILPLLPLFIVLFSLPLSAQPARPVISHEPPASVVSGQPLRVVARVNASEPLKEVVLHIAQTGGAAPVTRPMQSAGAGVYVGRIESDFFSALDEFRYYITARSTSGAFTETNWSTVQVIGGSARQTPEEGGWKRPVLIGAGAAVAVGAGVAIAGSGGGGGGGGDDGGDGGDPADQVIVRTASDRVDDASPILPSLTVIDVAGELAGRTITRVRIRIEFDGVDGGIDQFEVSYNGVVVINGSTGGVLTRQVDVVGTASTQVDIAILSSEIVEGTATYNWNATATYFVE